jgi:hypothetical protein
MLSDVSRQSNESKDPLKDWSGTDAWNLSGRESSADATPRRIAAIFGQIECSTLVFQFPGAAINTDTHS